jgi:hypothetical protein
MTESTDTCTCKHEPGNCPDCGVYHLPWSLYHNPDGSHRPSYVRIYEPSFGSEGNHLDVRPYVVGSGLRSSAVPTAALDITSPEGVHEGPDGGLVGGDTVHVALEDIPALIDALQQVAALSDEQWHAIWREQKA